MNPALLLEIGNLLTTLGPLFAQEVAAVQQARSADAATIATLEGQVQTMDAKRMIDWADADASLTTAAGS